MALVLLDRVQETTATTGTGTITLAGAVSGFQSFATIGDGNTTYYCVTSGANWEVGIGTYTASGTTLARTTILASSAAGAAITLAGTSNVFCVYPASKAVYEDENGNVVFSVNSTGDALRITQTGTGNALVVEDSANPDSTPFVVDAAGKVGIGIAPPAGTSVYNAKDITGATTSNSISTVSTVQSDVTSAARGYASVLSTAAAPFTTVLQHFYANQSTIGAGSTVSAQYGFYSETNLIGATNNYAFAAGNTAAVTSGKVACGFYSYINTATGGGTAYGFYSAGTAPNHLLGNTSIGTTASSAQLHVRRNSASAVTDALILQNSSGTTVGTGVALHFDPNANGTARSASIQSVVPTAGNYADLRFFTANGTTPAEAMRISNSQQVSIGSAGTNNAVTLYITRAIQGGGGTSGFGIYNSQEIQSDVTLAAYGNATSLSTAASAFTLSNLRHYQATQGTIGAGSTVANQYGFITASNNFGATNNFGFFATDVGAANVTAGKTVVGFYSNQAAASGGGTAYNFYAAGTAPNYLAGNLGIGTATPSTALDVNGTVTATALSGPHNGTVGATTPNTGAFTTLSASSTVSGTGFSTYLASPPAIGGTAAAAITGTTITANTQFSGPHNGTVGATTPNTGAFTTLSVGTLVSGYTFSSRTAGLGQAYFLSTDAGSGGMNCTFFKDSASPAAGDDIANLRFFGNDSASTATEYVRLTVTIADPTNASEDGSLSLATIKAGALGERVRYTSVDGLYVVDGAFRCPDAYASTTGTAANMVMSSASGILQRSTSSLRYKNSVADATYGLAEVMQLRPVTYKGNNDGDTVFGGFIAEEVHDIGLSQFVQYDGQNRPDALAYGNMVSLLTKAMQEQQALIEDLKARISVLEAR